MTAEILNKAPVIAVDGPSGAGKGDVSLFLAQTLGWRIMDSGALYRILAYKSLREGVATDDADALAELALGIDVTFVVKGGRVRIMLGGKDVGAQIRREEVGIAASEVAVWPEVRQQVVGAQRRQRRAPGLVADGRDMGTEVFPDANLKIFLDASAEARAHRRYEQLNQLGFSVSLESLLQSIVERDKKDRTRPHSPLIAAPDAVLIDTTNMLRETVRERVLEVIRSADVPNSGL